MDFRPFSALVVDAFFTTLEIEGAETVDATRPTIFVANHHSGLVDALVLYAASPVKLRSIGKSTLWKNPILLPFLKAAEAIPVYRHRDGGGDNTSMFAEVTSVLVEGGHIGIFGEGTSHDGVGLQELKTGAARMALDASAAGADVLVVPVGLIYEDRTRFRSHAAVRFGSPLDIGSTYSGVDSSDREAATELTSAIDLGLRVVAPVWSSPEQRASARTAAFEALPVGASLLEVEREAERAAMVSPALPEPDPRLVGDRGEAAVVVDPESVDHLAAAVVAGPAWVGRVMNAPPFYLIRLLATSRSTNIQATLKLIGGALLFPLWWTAIGVAVAMLAGSAWWGLGVAVTVALLGVVAAREFPLRRREREALYRARRLEEL